MSIQTVLEKNQKGNTQEWAEKKRQEREDFQIETEQAVVEARSSDDGFFKYLLTQAANPNLSASNVAALVHQAGESLPEVGSKEKWDALDRQINEGANPLKITIPVKYEGKDGQEHRAFNVGYVYEMRDTIGETLESKTPPITRQNDTLDKAFEGLVKASPVPIEIAQDVDAIDYQDMRDRIVIPRSVAENFEVLLLQEIMEMVAKASLYSEPCYEGGDELLELDSKSVVYLVSKRIGIPADVPNITNMEDFADGKEMKELRSELNQIQKTAKEIGNSIEKTLSDRQKDNKNLDEAER